MLTKREIPMQSRNVHGYLQYLERFKIGNKEINRWVFIITGFTFDLSEAYVLKSNCTDIPLPIDANDRILIMGKRYGDKHWIHYY